mgnify:CR=1 FL=1
MTQPRGVSLPPFGQRFVYCKVSSCPYYTQVSRCKLLQNGGHNCLTNKALRRTGQSAQRKFVSECDTCVISIYCRPAKRKAYEWGNTRKGYWRIADSFILHRKSPKQRPQHRGKSYSARATSSATYPMVRRKFTSMHGCNMMPLGRLYQHHVHTQRTLVAGGKML